MIVNEISLGFALLIRQNKTDEEVTLFYRQTTAQLIEKPNYRYICEYEIFV